MIRSSYSRPRWEAELRRIGCTPPIAAWAFLAGMELGGVVRCASVGWLIRDDDQVKALAPNMGGIDNEDSLQVSGVIQIPAGCIIKITRLCEQSDDQSANA